MMHGQTQIKFKCQTINEVKQWGKFIITGIQPLGRFGQRPELSQATSMALVRCILGKFLGVVCHCFPPRLDVPTFVTRCLHVQWGKRKQEIGHAFCERKSRIDYEVTRRKEKKHWGPHIGNAKHVQQNLCF